VWAHNVQYDAGWCATLGVDVHRVPWRDTQALSALLDEHARAHSLAAVCARLGLAEKDEALLRRAAAVAQVDMKSGIWQLPARYVGPYAQADAQRVWAARDALWGMLQAEDLGDVFRLETDQIPVLLAMRERGVGVDESRVAYLLDRFTAEADTLRPVLTTAGDGRPLSIWNTADIGRVATHLGLTPHRTALGNASYNKAWLQSVQDHPWAAALARARRIDKAINTFLRGYFVESVVAGRVHPQFYPLSVDEGGTISGRYSSANPNLQNIPARDAEYGAPLRTCLTPPDGGQWLAADYSQQEPRLTVHYAARAECRGADAAVRAYHDDPDTDFHTWMAELTGLPRRQAKGINLGMTYGMGEVALCHELGLPTETYHDPRTGRQREVAGEEGKKVFAAYHAHAPFVRELYELAQRRATVRGFLRTVGGRVCRFPPNISPHKALNRLIQGSAADMTKAAMRDVHAAGLCVLGTIHDELAVAGTPDDIPRLQQIMNDALSLAVPVRTDVGIGPTWGDAKS
jgi:DNA polymerase I-like protein with 3'-5' exonuclease and polymerase domains